MKRILTILLVAVCLAALVGCQAGSEQPQQTQPAQPQEIQEPYFTGKVLEKYEDSCLVEVTDIGNGNFAVGQDVIVHMQNGDFAVGDALIIVFDGKVTCSLPPQIACVEFYKS